MNLAPNVNSQSVHIERTEKQISLVIEAIADQFTYQWFDPDYWQQRHAIIHTAQGRGTTYFVQHQLQQWVLRHYYRGGLVGKLLTDQYLYLGIEKTRAWQEFSLLNTLQQLELPAPKPIAVNIERSGLIYRANIITERIANAQDLVGILQQQAITNELYQQIGRTIARFHQQGIYHHDLNCHNILIDDNQQIYIIDFDQGEQRKPEQKWQQQNLARLLRSFEKERNRLSNFYWQPSDWQQLLKGYQTPTKNLQ